MHVMLVQGVTLPDNRAYLNECSTITAFKCNKYLKGLKKRDTRIKINCNAGAVMTSLMGKYGPMNAWYIPKGIANIFSMNEVKKRYRVMFDSWEGYYIVHMASREVKFHKDEQGLPYINLEGSGCKAVVMLLKTAMEINGDEAKHKSEFVNVQTVRKNYEGYTKHKVLTAKEAHRVQGLVGNPSESDYKGMVRGNMIRNCPVTPKDILTRGLSSAPI
jgi:hypothetical protein